MRLTTFLYHSLWLTGASTALAALVNTTIDDKYGDPDTGALITYSPAMSWNDGTSCPGCTAHFDGSKAYMGTWHDGTFALANTTNPTPGAILTASVPFTGSAVYVYCIIGHTFESPDTNTDMTFLLDGQQVGTFKQKPTGAKDWDFNVPVYVNTSIPHGAHTLSIENGHDGQKSLVILDYVVYTHEAIQKPSNKTAIIAGAVAGPLALILIIAAVVLYFKRRRRHSSPYSIDLAEQFASNRPKSPPDDRDSDPSLRPTPFTLTPTSFDLTPQSPQYTSAQNSEQSLLIKNPSLSESLEDKGLPPAGYTMAGSSMKRPPSMSARSSAPSHGHDASEFGQPAVDSQITRGIGSSSMSEKAQLARLRLHNPTEEYDVAPPAYSSPQEDSMGRGPFQ